MKVLDFLRLYYSSSFLGKKINSTSLKRVILGDLTGSLAVCCVALAIKMSTMFCQKSAMTVHSCHSNVRQIMRCSSNVVSIQHA